MSRVYFLTVNTFLGLPPIKQLFHFYVENEVEKFSVVQCNITNFENFFDYCSLNQYFILSFKDSLRFNNQTVFEKSYKYVKFLYFFIKNYFFSKRDKILIHTIDLFTTYIAIIFKKRDTKIVYLQYEIIEPKHLNVFDYFLLKRIQKKSNKLDLIITPESNRTEYLKKILYRTKRKNFQTIPNTNNNFINLKEELIGRQNKKTIISHIGAVGVSHHIEPFLESVKKMNSELFEVRFIGLISEDVLTLINSYNLPNVKIIGQQLHSDLHHFYLETDIGIILYKDVSLNHRYCAPNKLYEYWSYGIPVIGDQLPGLTSVFTHQCLGQLVNMQSSQNIVNAIKRTPLGIESRLKVQEYFIKHLMLNNYLNELSKKLEM